MAIGLFSPELPQRRRPSPSLSGSLRPRTIRKPKRSRRFLAPCARSAGLRCSQLAAPRCRHHFHYWPPLTVSAADVHDEPTTTRGFAPVSVADLRRDERLISPPPQMKNSSREGY